MDHQDIMLRLGAALLCGLVLGLDRERKGISAGLRTHGMISLSSAAITVSALLLYEELRASGPSELDPLRVIQGLAQAVGFIGAGAIFVSGGNVRNLTTAANMWLAASVGIACGAQQFVLAAIATAMGLAVLVVLVFVEARLSSDREDEETPKRPPAGGA